MECSLVKIPWCPDNASRHACLDANTAFEVNLPITGTDTYADGVRKYIAMGWTATPGIWLIIDLERNGGMLVTIDSAKKVTQGITYTTAVPRLTTWPPKK